MPLIKIDRIPYILPGPLMDASVPSTALTEGKCGRIVGVDGRYKGCMRKFFGMSEVKDLDEISGGIDTRSGPYYMKAVTFQQRGTSNVYRGFVVSWDEGNSTTNLALDLFYTLDNGSNWSSHQIWAQSSSGITTTTEIDCMVAGAFLMVAVDGKATKTVYYGASALTTVSSGPGVFDSELTTMSLSTTAVDTSYQLVGNGKYQVAYRFYDSTRGIHSALSAPFTFVIDRMQTDKATGTVSFDSAGGDSGRFVVKDIITINSRTYEAADWASPGDTNCVLKLHLDGADQATATTDTSPLGNTISFSGNAQLDTAQKKWGTASLLLDGTGDDIYTSDHANFAFGSGNFTIEAQVRFNTLPSDSDMCIAAQYLTSGDKKSWRLSINDTSGVKRIHLLLSSTGSGEIIKASNPVTIAADTWYHVRVTRTSNLVYFYLDGVLDRTLSYTASLYDSDTYLTIGRDADGAQGLDGWIDEVGIWTEALSTISFTAPTAAYVDSDVCINIGGNSSISDDANSLAAATNGDASGDVYATAGSTTVLLEARTRGSAANAYDLSETETGGNTDDISVSYSTLTGGGSTADTPYGQCSATIDFPASDVVLSGYTFADFDALFDKVDIFRSINLGDVDSVQGAILYLEQTLDMPASPEIWSIMTTTIGTKVDESLPFQLTYDPEKDTILAPPQSGSIGRYEKITYMAEAIGVDSLGKSDYDTVHSSIQHISPEYFTTYNRRKGDPEEGRPLRFINAGDAMLILEPNAIVHVFKSTDLKPLIYTVLHRNRGLIGKGAAHAVGNSVLMITGIGLVMVDTNNGQMSQISVANRVLLGDWLSTLSSVESCYDSHMNASFFLNSSRSEMIVLWHSTKTMSMLEGANFVTCSSTVDITASSNKKTRAYFITDTGLIVTPDYLRAGTGTMWGLATGTTLDGTTDAVSATKNKIFDADATFHADMIGTLLYMTSGDNAGEAKEITAYTPVAGEVPQYLTTAAFTSAIAVGDRYSISPVPFSVRLWPLQIPDFVSKFRRWIMKGISLKVGATSGFTSNDNDKWRVGAYRNGGATIEAPTAEIDVDENPADSAGALSSSVDGIDVEPFVEQISTGTSFELVAAEVSVTVGTSRNVG